MKTLVLLLVFGLCGWPSLGAAEKVDDKLTAEAGAILKDREALAHGATRAKLLEHFTTEGGLFQPGARTFVSKVCPYIKVDVTFDVKPSQRDELPGDVIKTISRPYLQFTIAD